ncbi:HNH endonuclease [Paenibacillus sp. 22594]|uniref:HNH endonuclease n=1 Tax=Paenibacillus sp. 22594 TaxID=3453947 RepID=UPI003F8749CF
MNSRFVQGNVYFEITKSSHKHGGLGWEFGTCLWSPTQNRAGIDRYALMREPRKGDLILHFYNHNWNNNVYETKLCGTSIVKKSYYETNDQPEIIDEENRFDKYYRIDLYNYEEFESPLTFNSIKENYGDEIRKEIVSRKPKYYPFNTYGDSIRTVQGIYLAQCTSNLYLILKEALEVQEGQGKFQTSDLQNKFAEGLRSKRESYFFARNKALAKAAKEYYGYTCCICDFNFEKVYGELGVGYIECHHLSPLSERPQEEWSELLETKIDDVRVVCSNCHRVIHSKKPALTIEQVKMAYEKNRT